MIDHSYPVGCLGGVKEPLAPCLAHSRCSIPITSKDEPPACVQALQTSSSLAPKSTLALYLCVLASKAVEGWRVPAKTQRPGVVPGARDGEASQERASSQHLNSPPCLAPPPRVSPSDNPPLSSEPGLVRPYPKEQGLWRHRPIPALPPTTGVTLGK